MIRSNTDRNIQLHLTKKFLRMSQLKYHSYKVHLKQNANKNNINRMTNQETLEHS